MHLTSIKKKGEGGGWKDEEKRKVGNTKSVFILNILCYFSPRIIQYPAIVDLVYSLFSTLIRSIDEKGRREKRKQEGTEEEVRGNTNLQIIHKHVFLNMLVLL
jgi:hypothetical protein